jgi:SpoVK/Ycf46/Vps4 family AAA+-type ATPase
MCHTQPACSACVWWPEALPEEVAALRKFLQQQTLGVIMQQVNEGVIVIAATNIPESLDPALTRPGRFDRTIAVPLPVGL